MAYTASNSLLRAKRLQEVCQSEGLTSIVFILGIDSRRNRMDEKLFFWLFLGISGEEAINSTSLQLNYEEIALIVTPISCHIYVGSACNNYQDTVKIFKQVQEISASWPGIDLVTLTKEEILDSELAEISKVLWFNRTMSRLVGPVGVCSDLVESWPLVQAYAIDLFGLGFFSQSHSPKNISDVLVPIFLEFDDAAVLAVIYEHLPRLFGLFQLTIDFVNKKSYLAGRAELTENLISECFTLPFEYATIQSRRTHPVQPYAKLWNFDNVKKVSSAHHVTCMGVCGITGIVCARTWFFFPSGGAKEFIENCYGNNSSEDDLEGMIEVYKAITKAVRIGIRNGGTTQEQTNRILYELFKEKVFTKYHHMLESVRKAEIRFASYDADGNTLDYNENLPLHSVVFKASNVGAKDFSNLGEILFAETFVNKENLIEIITENVEDFIMWERNTKKPSQSPYGERLSTIEHTEVFIEKFGVFEGTLLMYEEGWAFRSIHLGQLEYNLEEFCNVEHYSNDTIGFFTSTYQITIKPPNRSAQVLTSVWKIESTEDPEPEFPMKKKISWPMLPSNSAVNPNKIPVYLVIGISGSGKTKTGKDIARGLRVNCIVPPLWQSTYLDAEFWNNALSEIKNPCVIVLPSFCTPFDFSRIIPQHLYVKTIICKVNAHNVYMGAKKEFIPGVIHLIQSCNALIFEENENTELFSLCTLMNESMEIFKVNGTIGPQQARNIINIEKKVPVQLPYKSIILLETLFVNVPLSLVESKIKQRLANSEITDEGSLAKRITWANDMDIWRLKGCVEYFNQEKTFYEISGTAKYFQSAPSLADSQGILFIGRNLDIAKIYDFILDCRSHVSKLPLKTRKFLSQSEVEMVENNLAENSEYIFDGSHFVDTMGKRYKIHPDLEQALCDYVDEENERIGGINRSIEKERNVLKKANLEAKVRQVFV